MQFELTKDFIDEIINAIENANDDFLMEILIFPVEIFIFLWEILNFYRKY